MTLNVNPELALDVDNVTITTTVSGLKSLFPRYSIVHLMSHREVNKDLPGYALIGKMGNLLYAKIAEIRKRCSETTSQLWDLQWLPLVRNTLHFVTE